MTTSSWYHDIVEGWRESARFWEKHHETIQIMFAPITEALVAAMEFAPEQTILDVAGGTGEPSLTIAGLVGASGRIAYTDIAPGMVAAARRGARSRGLTNFHAVNCSGDSLPFRDDVFDAVVSRLGVMFFPDPVRALGEMLRVTKPRGRIGLAVWGTKETNPFFRVPTEVVNHHVDSTPEPPDAPGAWRFGDSGLLAGMLRESGAVEVREDQACFDIAAALAFDEFWTMRVELSDTLREKMGRLSPEEASRVTAEIRTATEPFFADGTMRFPASILIVTGRAR